jgi:hypothetical protein
MDERDLEAKHPAPRRLVDQLGTRFREVDECSADVVDLIRDMVHPRPVLREETADRRVVVQRAEQLEPAFAHSDRRGFDSLVVDAGALLEPGAEKALVRVERTVEILDRETHVVHGAGRPHPAIVCERLAATMRASALALLLTAVLIAGCGGHGKSAKSNGEASKPPGRVLADARAAVSSASSVHVSGSIVADDTPITLDLDIANGKGAKGSMAPGGLQFDLVQIGDAAYIRGTDAFWQHYAGVGIAQLLHRRWVKVSTSEPRFRILAPLTSISLLFDKVAARHGTLTNEGTTSYEGQQVVEIRDTSHKNRLYVAATGKPYPLAIVVGEKSRSGTVRLGSWNKSVSLTAPKGAIDISQLGG